MITHKSKRTLTLTMLLATSMPLIAQVSFEGTLGGTLTQGVFYDLRGVDFNTNTSVYNNPSYPSQNGVEYKDLDLRYSRFIVADLTGASFAGKDLSNSQWADNKLYNADFAGANISNIYIYNSDFTKAQIQSTLNWANKDMSNMDITGARFNTTGLTNMYDIFAGENLSGFNLSNSQFGYNNFKNTQFAGANITGILAYSSDFRGATGISLSDINASEGTSVVWSDGIIMHYDGNAWIEGAGTTNARNFIAGAHELDAVLTVSSSFDELFLEVGSVLRIEEGVKLSMEKSLICTVNETGSSLLKVSGELVLTSDSGGGYEDVVAVIMLPFDFDTEGYYEFMLIELDGGTITGGTFEANKTVFAGHQDVDSSLSFYEGAWDIFTDEQGNVWASFGTIPEPSTYAAILGVLALAFAAYRRRK